jgi:uncharacterized protein
MSEWDLRRAQVADMDAIRALTTEGMPGVSTFEPNELEWAFEHADGIWIAEANNQVMGYVLTFGSRVLYDGEEFQWFQRNMDSFLYIDRIALAATARGKSLGRTLYNQVSTFAREKGYPRLVCEVNLEPPNPNSLAFHKALGFETIGTLDTHDGRTVALLSKYVEPSDG